MYHMVHIGPFWVLYLGMKIDEYIALNWGISKNFLERYRPILHCITSVEYWAVCDSENIAGCTWLWHWRAGWMNSEYFRKCVWFAVLLFLKPGKIVSQEWRPFSQDPDS